MQVASPVFVSILLKKGTNAGIFLRDFDYLVVFSYPALVYLYSSVTAGRV